MILLIIDSDKNLKPQGGFNIYKIIYKIQTGCFLTLKKISIILFSRKRYDEQISIFTGLNLVIDTRKVLGNNRSCCSRTPMIKS